MRCLKDGLGSVIIDQPTVRLRRLAHVRASYASCTPGVPVLLGDQTPSITTENPYEVESWRVPVEYLVRRYDFPADGPVLVPYAIA